MNTKKSTFNKAVYFIIIATVLYGFILLVSDLNKIILVLNQIALVKYLPILLLSVVTLLILGWRYQIILNKLNLNFGFRESFWLHTAGIAMIITPGGIGSIIKSYFIKKKTGRSISSTTPILLYERWLDIVVLTIMIGGLLLWDYIFESLLVLTLGIFLSGFTFFMFKNRTTLKIFNGVVRKIRILNNFVVNEDEFFESTKILMDSKSVLSLLGVTFLSKVVPLIAVYLVFDLFDLKISLFTSGLIYFTSQIVGLFSFIPGGIVVTEAGLLGLILKQGIDLSVAATLVLLIRILTFWFPTAIGFIALKSVLTKNYSNSRDMS
jgi:hypothetical protein